jgi:hypothetical protein
MHMHHFDVGEDGRRSRTNSTPEDLPSGRMKLYRHDYRESPEFVTYAFFGEAKIAVEMELNPKIDLGYPSHLAFRPGRDERWVLELQWEQSGKTKILGTLELQQAESAADQELVTFYWRSVNETMCREVNLLVNDLVGWKTGIVLKSRVGQ